MMQNLRGAGRCRRLSALHAGQSHATVFAAWQVANVPLGDTLNVRKYPSSNSQKQAAYPNGTVLQMTGKLHRRRQSARHFRQARLEAGAARPLPLVRGLARPGPERPFRHRLGLRQVHRAALSGREDRPQAANCEAESVGDGLGRRSRTRVLR